MQINMHEWSKSIIELSETKVLPIMTYPGLSLTGLNVMDVITDGKKQFECIEALAKKYPSAAAVTIMDLSLEAEAFGSKIRFSEHDVPTVIGKIISTREDAENLCIPEVGAGRTSVYLEAAELAAKKINDRPVLGGCIGPFSLSGRLMDMTEIMIALMEEPETVHIVLEKATNFLIKFAKAFKEKGANGIIIAEPAAGLLSPLQCADFSSQYNKKIISEVQDENFLVVLHNCGNTVRLVDTMVSTGAMGLHFGNAVKMTDILPQVPGNILAFGNINPSGRFKNGTKEEMEEAVYTLLSDMVPYKNFVLSSGCDIPPGTPYENIEVFFETLKKFNRK